MKKAYANIPEGQVHYIEDGTGEPLLLLHQTPMSSDEYLDIIPFLSKSYRVIAMDSVGYGNSDIPPREYGIEDFGRSVISLLDALGVDKTNLVGHHTGAAIAVAVASGYPERIDKLVLSACPYWPQENWQQMFKRQQSRPNDMDRDGQFLTDMWKLFKNFSPNTGPEVWIKPLINSLRTRIRNPYNTHRAVSRYNIGSRLPLIKSPTLVIIGDRDMFVDQLEETKSLIPRSKTQIIDDGGVLTCFEKPKEWSEAILGFLNNPGV